MQELSAEATAIAAELGDPEARALAAAARRRAFWDPAHLDQRLADADRAADAARARRATSSSPCRATPGSCSICSSTATGRRRRPDRGVQPRARSGCASRCTCGTPRSGGRCGRCSADGCRKPTRWRARRWRPGRTARRSPRRSTTRSSCWRSAASRAGWRELEPPRASWSRSPIPTGRPGAPRSRRCCGRPGSLRRPGRVRAARRSRLRGIPHDGDWMTAMTLLADCSVELGDRRARRRSCTSCCCPTPRCNVVIGLAAVCLGSAARFLGRLAATSGAASDGGRALRARAGRQRRRSGARSGSPTPSSITRGCSGPDAAAAELIDAAERRPRSWACRRSPAGRPARCERGR